jgi:hypothetical protein
MFTKAIEIVDGFTRPVHTITRTYGGLISPGASTLFFVNEEGVAITCKHVIDLIVQAQKVNDNYLSFKNEKGNLPNDYKFRKNLVQLENKYHYKKETVVQIKNNFINSVNPVTRIQTITHPTLDLGIIKFEGFTQKNYFSYATFVRDSSKIIQGRYLCRLGFPFPEFNNFQYNTTTDDIEWTNTGAVLSPRFPIDGIITRHIGDHNQRIIGIEMSTPGLRGQSGGPLFDTEGLIYGMQYATHHLHLGFDIKDLEIVSGGKKSRVSNFPFLHVGQCIHSEIIKEFLTLHKIKYYVES